MVRTGVETGRKEGRKVVRVEYRTRRPIIISIGRIETRNLLKGIGKEKIHEIFILNGTVVTFWLLHTNKHFGFASRSYPYPYPYPYSLNQEKW